MWHDYPYTNFHEANQDWILRKIKELQKEMHDFEIVNQISFSGAWDISKQYPAWTIVSDNNIGYVSIQPVPAGVLLTNGDYWREVIDYTAQIAGLQSRVIALEGDMLTVQGDITTLQGNITSLDTKINNNMDICTAEDVIILADSYGVDASAGGYSWSSQLEDNLTNCTVYSSVIGGTSFASDLYMSDNWLSMLQGLTVAAPKKVKHIIILGGANDGNLYDDGTLDATTLRNRIDAFCAYAATNYPNATVEVSFVGWNRNTNRYSAYIDTRAIYRSELNKFQNAAYYANGEVILHNSDLINSLDLIHPTQAGSDKLAVFAMSIINGGQYTDNYLDSPVLTPYTNVSSISHITSSDIIYDDDKAQFNLIGDASGTYINVSFSTPMATSSGWGSANIATVTKIPYVKTTTGPYLDVPCVIGVTGVGVKKAHALVVFNAEKMAIRVYDIEDYVNGWTIDNVLLPPLSVTFDRRVN